MSTKECRVEGKESGVCDGAGISRLVQGLCPLAVQLEEEEQDLVRHHGAPSRGGGG